MSYYITDAESLGQLPLNKLTAKDRILVLSGTQASIPVSLFGVLKDLKVDFVTVPGMDGEDDAFALGYLFGYYAAQARPGEQIKLYNRGEELIPAGVQTPGQKKKPVQKKPENAQNHPNPQKAPQKAQEEPFGELTRFLSGDDGKAPQKASEKTVQNEAQKKKSPKPVTEGPAPEKAAPAPAKRSKKSGLSEQLALAIKKADDLDFVLKTVKGREFMLEECITQSTDAEIGYKMKLEMFFGPANGGRIWDLTKGSYEKLKKAL